MIISSYYDILLYFLYGFVCSMYGFFIVYKKISTTTDTVSHIGAAGSVFFMIMFNSSDMYGILISTFAFGCLGFYIFRYLSKYMNYDSAISSSLSFALGISATTLFYSQHIGIPCDPESLFIGPVMLGFIDAELYILFFILLSLFIFILFFRNPLLYSIFDKAFLRSDKFLIVNIAFSVLIVLIITLGMVTVGVMMMIAMIVGPINIIRYWITKYTSAMLVSSLLGGFIASISVIISQIYALPLGALTSFVVIVLFIISSILVVFKKEVIL